METKTKVKLPIKMLVYRSKRVKPEQQEALEEITSQFPEHVPNKFAVQPKPGSDRTVTHAPLAGILAATALPGTGYSVGETFGDNFRVSLSEIIGTNHKFLQAACLNKAVVAHKKKNVFGETIHIVNKRLNPIMEFTGKGAEELFNNLPKDCITLPTDAGRVTADATGPTLAEVGQEVLKKYPRGSLEVALWVYEFCLAHPDMEWSACIQSLKMDVSLEVFSRMYYAGAAFNDYNSILKNDKKKSSTHLGPFARRVYRIVKSEDRHYFISAWSKASCIQNSTHIANLFNQLHQGYLKEGTKFFNQLHQGYLKEGTKFFDKYFAELNAKPELTDDQKMLHKMHKKLAKMIEMHNTQEDVGDELKSTYTHLNKYLKGKTK